MDLQAKTAAGAPPATISRPEMMPDGTDRLFRALVHRLLAFSSRLEAIRARFGELIGLSGGQYTILICVAHLGDGGGVGVKRIADHLGYTGAFVTIEAGNLAALGLVKKRQNQIDRRRVLLSVTRKGRELLARLAPTQRQVNDALFASLGARDFTRMAELAGELVDDADNALRMLKLMTLTRELETT